MEGDVKNNTPIGELRLGVKVDKLKNHTSVKVTIEVGSLQLAARVAPAALCIAATDELVTPDLEDVCEIRPQRDLELNVYRAFGIADQVQIFVNAVGDAAANTQPDLLGGKVAQVSRQCGVGQFDSRRVVLHRAGCEQRPRCTVDV